MKNKNVAERFSQELDRYLKSKEAKTSLEPVEEKKLLELGNTLANLDFSEESNKSRILARVLNNDTNKFKGVKTFKKKVRTAFVAAAAICILSLPLLQTSFAQNLAEKIIKTISLGHITAIQTEKDNTAVPDILKGQIFDEEGKPITTFSEEYTGKYYTVTGEEIVGYSGGELITKQKADEQEQAEQEQKLVVRNPQELNKYTCFEVIIPGYLPQGYKFERAEFYRDEKGVVGKKYIDLYFSSGESGKEIFMQQRYADDETAYEIGTDETIEQIKINSADAVLINNTIDWEKNNVLYCLSGRGHITKRELIKIAESI